MGTVYVCANQKGGVGKTTTVINLGASLAEKGKTVLLVDLDPQANLTSGLGVDKQRDGIYTAMFAPEQEKPSIQKLSFLDLFIIPSNIDLSGAQVELFNVKKKEFFLKNIINKIRDNFDYIIIDAPPSLDILTVNALAAADLLIIPLQCEYFSLEGLSDLMQTYQRIKKNINPELEIHGILFTMYDRRLRVAQDVILDVLKHFKGKTFETIIPRNVKLAEAPSHGLPITVYDPLSTGAKSYQRLAEEVLHYGEEARA